MTSHYTILLRLASSAGRNVGEIHAHCLSVRNVSVVCFFLLLSRVPLPGVCLSTFRTNPRFIRFVLMDTGMTDEAAGNILVHTVCSWCTVTSPQ